MAAIKAFIRTSTKNKEANIRIRLSDGRDFARYGITNVKILPEYWDNKKEEVKPRAVLPDKYDKAKINESIRILKNKIEFEYSKIKDKSALPSNWIDMVLTNDYLEYSKEDKSVNIIDLFIKYKDQSKVSDSRKQQIKVAIGLLSRYMEYYDKLCFNVADIDGLENFFFEEHNYQILKPELYKNERTILKRGINTLNSKFKIIKAFFTWAVKNEYVDKNPFINYTFKTDIYGDPIPLLPEEVDIIYRSDVPDNLKIAKDMFCLQCYTGCRVGDFIELRKENVNEDILEYIANKTISEKATTVYVPLIDRAIAIIDKYKCEDGKLLPFINVNGKDGYNKKIKKILESLKLNRNVVTINSISGKPENKKLYEVVSSHTARKTFINSNYKETQDPKLISKMTGHSENSNAFGRYRNIDIDILRKQMRKAFDKNK